MKQREAFTYTYCLILAMYLLTFGEGSELLCFTLVYFTLLYLLTLAKLTNVARSIVSPDGPPVLPPG